MHRRQFLSTAAALMSSAAMPFTLPALAADADPADALLAPWTGDHGGFPPFDKAKPATIKAAMMKAMDLNRTEMTAIAASSEAANFANTLAALEDSGRAYDRASTCYGIFAGTMNDAEMKALQAEMSPVIANFNTELTQNAAVFARIKAVYDGRDGGGLNPEQVRLAEVVYKNNVRQGAALTDAQKTRAKAINEALATLYTKFSQNELDDEQGQALILESQADLDGVPDSLKASAKAAAEAKGQAGKWLVANTRSSMEPFLTFSTKRDLREKGWRLWVNRGDNNDAHDNKKNIADILMLRTERAQLLGFETHAHWATDNNMAKTPEAALDLMMKVWGPAVARAKEEVADMQAVADKDGANLKIEPWDYRFYAEKVRKAKYDLDENEVKPYLQLDKIREGMFWAAGKNYGLIFTRVEGLPVYHPDVTVYEVSRGGKRVGLWYFDPYARDGKRSGAWMNAYRSQERFKEETTPIVSNNANFIKAAPGEPILVSWDDATTMFHEFGHALHGLNSDVTYPTLSGTAVKRDFVEFPSQINEHWFPTPEVLSQFAVHYQTGKPMPDELLAKIKKAKTFNEGFSTVEYLSAALYDMKIHLAATAEKPIDPAAFEKNCMEELGMPKEIVMRHRPTQFGHAFAGDGYSAGYYVYLWADALTADCWEVFDKNGAYDTATAESFRKNILAVGNSVPPEIAFRNFRGRDVDTEALMRQRGFA